LKIGPLESKVNLVSVDGGPICLPKFVTVRPTHLCDTSGGSGLFKMDMDNWPNHQYLNRALSDCVDIEHAGAL